MFSVYISKKGRCFMQTPKRLKAQHHIDFPEGYRCRFINSITERNVLHSHEYYEIFLTLTDDIAHEVNGVCENLKIGSLTFIRPNDVHIYIQKKIRLTGLLILHLRRSLQMKYLNFWARIWIWSLC